MEAAFFLVSAAGRAHAAPDDRDLVSWIGFDPAARRGISAQPAP